MSETPRFHGSDLEEIEKYYGIPKENIIGFGANVNPLGISDTVKSEIIKNLDIITTYPDRNYTTLRNAIGKYCQVSPDHVVVGNGSTELISLLIQHIHPKNALLLGPTYSEYERELSLCGGKMKYYYLSPEQKFRIHLDEFLHVLDDSMQLLILCNPNNPTSSAILKEDMEIILTHCKKLGIFVMIDETYVEFAQEIENVTAMPFVANYDNLMIIRGVSKFFAAPGLRLGYGVTSNAGFMEVLHTHQNPWSLNSVGAFAGELMLQDEEYITATRELIHLERTRIYNALLEIPELNVFRPVANFFLVKILKEGVTSYDVFVYLIQKGLMVRDCASFECLEGEYIRFCIMKPEDNTRLLNGLIEFFKS